MQSETDTGSSLAQPQESAVDTGVPIIRDETRSFYTAPQATALLEVSEHVLRRWRGIGYGPQPEPQPRGWLYAAARIDRLAVIAMPQRRLSISRG